MTIYMLLTILYLQPSDTFSTSYNASYKCLAASNSKVHAKAPPVDQMTYTGAISFSSCNGILCEQFMIGAGRSCGGEGMRGGQEW